MIWEHMGKCTTENKGTYGKTSENFASTNPRGFEDRTHPCKLVFQKFLMGLVWKTRVLSGRLGPASLKGLSWQRECPEHKKCMKQYTSQNRVMMYSLCVCD